MSSEIHSVLTHISELLLSYSHVVHSSGTTQAGKILKKRKTILENHLTNSSGKELTVINNNLVVDRNPSQAIFVLSSNSESSQVYHTKPLTSNDLQLHEICQVTFSFSQVKSKRGKVKTQNRCRNLC